MVATGSDTGMMSKSLSARLASTLAHNAVGGGSSGGSSSSSSSAGSGGGGGGGDADISSEHKKAPLWPAREQKSEWAKQMAAVRPRRACERSCVRVCVILLCCVFYGVPSTVRALFYCDVYPTVGLLRCVRTRVHAHACMCGFVRGVW